ncbi:hypothetical protein Btru_066612 [Bulinus truncatus]|nr:hypothetical protein Btru_066612 [Bulinus truncatus]
MFTQVPVQMLNQVTDVYSGSCTDVYSGPGTDVYSGPGTDVYLGPGTDVDSSDRCLLRFLYRCLLSRDQIFSFSAGIRSRIGLKAIYKQSKPQFENTSQITMISKLDYVFSKWKQHQLGFLDKSKALIYIAHENKVLQIKTSKCQRFVTCNQCNTNMCRWCPLEKMCVDKLYGEKICNATSDHYCPPMIESIQPKEIPKEGGTILYLNGSNFGNDSSKISVTVCNRSCHNVTVEDRLVTCTTGPVCSTSSSEMCHVQLTKTADDTKNENFATPSDKDSQLHCVTPQISFYSPQYGPVSGGIQVQFTGKHLLAGNNVTINVAGRNCGSIQRNGQVDRFH